MGVHGSTWAAGFSYVTVQSYLGGIAMPLPGRILGLFCVPAFTTTVMMVSLHFAPNHLGICTVTTRTRPWLEVLESRDLCTRVVHIDAAWLEQAAGKPILLDRANTTYVLDVDVTTAGTAFVVAAPDVTFDLNGHTIVYGNSEPIDIVNPGFELGAGSSVPGWDLAAAPSATKVPAMTGMYGQSMLQFADLTGIETIISDPMPVPTSFHEYAAAITAKAPYGSMVTIRVVDHLTGEVLGTGSSANTERGFAAVATFTPSSNNPVHLQIDVAPPAQQSASIALDYAALVPSRDYGIMATQLWSGQFPSHLQLPYIVESYRDAARFTVRNGSIIQGQGEGRKSSPLFLQDLPGFTVTGVSTKVTGMDSHNLDAEWAQDGAITTSIFDGSADRVSNRMEIVAAINLGNFRGSALVIGNQIKGVPHVGVLVAGMADFEQLNIRDNDIRQNAVVTDGYGILLAGVRNFEVKRNTIAPANGRGILLDGWGRIATEDGIIEGNEVHAVEQPNLEYGASLEATALRIRNGSSTFRNLLIIHNNFAATTGTGAVFGALGMRISASNDHGQLNASNIQISHNHFKAIVTTANPSYKARAVSVSQVDPGTGLVIASNTMESNDAALTLGDNDSWNGSTSDVWMGYNTLRRTTEGASRTFASVIAGAYQTAVSDIYMPFTFLQNGATAIVVYGTGPVTNLRILWRRNG
jgi:hypothetical protein